MGPLDPSIGSRANGLPAQLASQTPARSGDSAGGEHDAPRQDAATPVAGETTRGQAAFNLDRLADALGMDPDELLRRIGSGQGLGDALSGEGATGYGSTVGDEVSGGVVVDRYA